MYPDALSVAAAAAATDQRASDGAGLNRGCAIVKLHRHWRRLRFNPYPRLRRKPREAQRNLGPTTERATCAAGFAAA